MYLKNLTVLGFKSFSDKTALKFQPGVTAIVGPNGCGKSNVSDAIRWVLGEQSAKALRGGEMADVIFNGTDSRKPLGMAEVSLTIGGVDEEHLKAAGIEVTYDEVTVTRRVFRDGGSEYFINKTSCRLKDIQQLFAGTGMGKASYSIMAQGNITQILSSKPDDRRLVFEEAAGITKFKAQKREALRKLDATEQNLLRLQDLIKEVKRQIGSLQRQAGKARRYRAIATELQHLETQLARHQFDVLNGEIAERQGQVEKLKVESEVCAESVLRLEDEVLQLRTRLNELDERIAASQQEGVELKGQIERHEHRIQFNEQRLNELHHQNARAHEEILESEERRRVAEEELSSVVERLATSQSTVQQQQQVLQERRERLSQVEGELIRMQDAFRRAQSEAFSAGQQVQRARNELNTLDLQKQGNLVRLEKLNSEKLQLEEERNRLEARLNDFSTNAAASQLRVQSHRGTVEERQARLKQLQQEIIAAGQELDVIVRQQAEKRSRLHVLEQLQESHEGFSGGALAALRQSKAVIGSLADRIRVPDAHVTAVEASLGQNLQLVLTQQPSAAREILAALAAGKKGRASIAALDLRGTPVPTLPPELPGVLALSVISADESVQPLLGSLLGRTCIVPDLETATQAFAATGGEVDFVTAAGEVLSRHGVFTGGAGGGGQAPSSILGRKNQIAELTTVLAGLQERADEASRKKGALQAEQTELQAGLQQAQAELRQQEVALAAHEGEQRALIASQRQLQQKLANVTQDLERLSGQDEAGAAKRAQLAAQLADGESREAAAASAVAGLSQEIEGVRQQRDAATAALTEAKVALATEEQLCAALGRQQGPLQQRIRELTQRVDQRRNEISAFDQRRDQALAEIEDSRREIEERQHERETVSRRTADLLGEKATQESDIASREEQLRGHRRRLNEVQTHRAQLDVELAQKTMQSQNLHERIQQKYQVNLNDVRPEGLKITFADQGAAQVETISAEELAAQGLATDWKAVADQVNALQQRVDEMGPVNLVAIDEYEETEQRHTFLSTQYDDLVQAKAQLLEVINKINTQTRDMFVTTFNQIRDNFRSMFSEIFGGGKADLVLVEEGDVLESGIDIVARPPGKQLQSISLLSGGEQTMTAVALLFSIYQVKPSPFCVLDELDAPLDESNINRFIRVLQRFLGHSQFIIITHNKRTIGMADVLYGVTMQEHGVSRIVSVKFHKSDEPALAEAQAHARPLVPPPPGPTVDREEDAPHTMKETLEMTPAAS